MTLNSQKEYKTLWEKEKLLVTNNFSFSHSVFKRQVLVKTRACLGMGLIKSIKNLQMTTEAGSNDGLCLNSLPDDKIAD